MELDIEAVPMPYEPEPCPECAEAEYLDNLRNTCWFRRREYLEGAVADNPGDHRLWNEYRLFLDDCRDRRGW